VLITTATGTPAVPQLNEIMEAKSGLPPIPVTEIERLLARSADTIHRYTAIACLLDNSVYSGVYVKCFGYEGILTAGHCASEFLAASRFALVVSENAHQFWVEPSFFEHIAIEHYEYEDYTTDGPDLSFAIIRDINLLRTLRGLVAFYDLDNQDTNIFRNDLAKFNWSIAGVPSEKIQETKIIANFEENRMVNITAAVMQGNLVSIETTNNFDYIKLRLLTGIEEFPKSYNGVSGGGIWYQRFIVKEDKTYTVEPILAGITVWQSKEPEKMQRFITGHGFASIYGTLRRVLAQKRSVLRK
jgi:hypothetical protein